MELLANILRPKKITDIIGQSQLVGKDKVITNMIKNKKVFSMILYGRPGIGKTSIASAITNELDIKYRFLNATVNTNIHITAIKIMLIILNKYFFITFINNCMKK